MSINSTPVSKPMSIKERMAAFTKKSEDPDTPARSASIQRMLGMEKEKEPEAKGERLLDGMLERETVVVGMVRYAKRFAVLFSDPFLGMYDAVDQTKAVKGGRSLVGCTAEVVLIKPEHPDYGRLVEIKVPDEKPIKLRTATAAEAEAWVIAITAAVGSSAPGDAASEVPASPVAHLFVRENSKTPKAAPDEAKAPSLERESSSALWGVEHKMEKPNQAHAPLGPVALLSARMILRCASAPAQVVSMGAEELGTPRGGGGGAGGGELELGKVPESSRAPSKPVITFGLEKILGTPRGGGGGGGEGGPRRPTVQARGSTIQSASDDEAEGEEASPPKRTSFIEKAISGVVRGTAHERPAHSPHRPPPPKPPAAPLAPAPPPQWEPIAEGTGKAINGVVEGTGKAMDGVVRATAALGGPARP
jgi:hypothetical protein